MRHGYHQYDLLYDSNRPGFDDPPALDRAECEVWLDGRRTRADIAGRDKDGTVLWVIEIRRSGLSKAAVDHAQDKGTPLFVVDLSHLPQPTEDDPWAEIRCQDYFVLAENLVQRVLPVSHRVIQHGLRTGRRSEWDLATVTGQGCASMFTVVRATATTKDVLTAKKWCSTNAAR